MRSQVIEASNLVKYYRKKKEPALDNLNQVLMSWLALPLFTIVFLSLALFKAKWTEN